MADISKEASCSSRPSKALSMEMDTALYRIRSLFGAIRALSNAGLSKEEETYIVDLAALEESIAEDQLAGGAQE